MYYVTALDLRIEGEEGKSNGIVSAGRDLDNFSDDHGLIIRFINAAGIPNSTLQYI